MPKRTSYAQGTPSWVDLQTTDQDAAKAFYGELFGWQFDDQAMPQGGTYSMALKDGDVVAAISPQVPEVVAQGLPPFWNTYITVEDVDATTAAVEGAGGQVYMAPSEVMDAGRMSTVADPTGAVVNFWQPRKHIGATLVNEPGSLIWNELLTDNAEAAYSFYATVLGLSTEASDLGDMAYTVFKAGDKMVAGSMAPPMENIANHWHVYFAVDAMGPALDKARQLGAKVLNGPIATPIGAMATLIDPQGAVVSLFEPTGQGE
ncbi:MAG: VOC family protein [Acidimicrobiales bacterium]|jgi:predicted enzyme related to lactoylglutathione lyase